MSSRALRRLQRDDDLGDLAIDDDDLNIVEGQDIEKATKKKSKKKGKQASGSINPFELLDNGADDHISSDHDAENDIEDEKVDTDMPKPAVKPKKKKKSKKAQKENDEVVVPVEEKEKECEIEASVQEVNRILGEVKLTCVQHDGGKNSRFAKMKSLLHIDYRNLNPMTELKKMFGSEVVRGENQEDGTNRRRQRNRPAQRLSKLVQVKNKWNPTGGTGLSMKYLSEQDGFMFEHSPAYQRRQYEFIDAVESGQPQAFISLLKKHPYHIDTLMQLSDYYRMNEDFQLAGEMIEIALYGMECAFHPVFNIAAGKCYLPYNRPENRPFYLCVFKHILNLGSRGCNRTAFEFCKLLLSLDPEGDPLDCMSMIDFYALRSEQYEYLLRLEQEALSPDVSKRVPNFAFSIALATFKEALKKGEDTKVADELLQDALLCFPLMLIPLLDQCSVQPDKRVSSHSYFNTKDMLDNTRELGRMIQMYIKRCEPCWKEVQVMNWLERNVLIVLDIVDSGTDMRIGEYAELTQKGFRKPPLSLLRHYFLAEIQGVSPPQRFTTGPVLSYDPFPPPDSIISYSRPPRPTVASQGQGFFRSLLESLNPAYNPNELPGARHPQDQRNNNNEEEGAAGGNPRAIPEGIQDSVQAIMEAMRQLLNDPLAMMMQQGDPQDELDEEEDGADWGDEDEER